MADRMGLAIGDAMKHNADGGPRRPAVGGRLLKKILLFTGAGLVVLAGVAMSVRYSGLLGGSDEAGGEPVQTQPAGHYLELDEMVVTLGAGGKSQFLKLTVTLELESAADEARIRAVMPRIVDYLQVFLRELRIDELRGSRSLYRVRRELLTRVNAAAHPTKVKDLLFKELVIQ